MSRLLAAILLALAAAADVSAQGRIEEVTIFEDRARVVRRVPAELALGVSRVEIRDLPDSLSPSSVLADVEGVAARVLGVRLDRTVHESDIRAEVRALEEEARELSAAERARRGAHEVAGKRRELAERFAAFLRQGMLERSTRADPRDTEGLLAAEEWVSAQVLAAEDAAAALEREIAELARRRQEVEENLARLRAGARRATIVATVQVEASAAGAGTVRIGYDVADARWRPVHEARLDEASAQVAWSYGAEIVQETGEEWRDVALTLSTLRSSLGLAPPALVPVRVSGQSTGKREVTVAGEAVPGELGGDASSGEEGEESEDLSRAAIEGEIARFRIPVPATIPADGRSHRVPIIETTLPAELAFEAAPSLSPHTYRRAELANGTDAPFLPGTVRVFREGTYVGEAELAMVPPGAAFRLGFGVEGRIAIHRTEITDRERGTGTFQKGERRTIGWRFAIASALPAACELVLVDRIPVSEIEGVKVELTGRCDPGPEVDEDGICRWHVPLAPGEERAVLFEYQVTAPKGIQVPGWLED